MPVTHINQSTLTVNASIAVLIGLANHLVNLVVGKLLTNGGHDVTQLGGGDEAVVVAVKDLFRVNIDRSGKAPS